MNIPNKDNPNTSALKSLNLSVQLLSTLNSNQTHLFSTHSKPITKLDQLKTRLTQVNKKFEHNRDTTETTLNWIKQQGVNLNNIKEIIRQQRKGNKERIVQPVVRMTWEQVRNKQFQQLPFNEFIFKNQERIAYSAIMAGLAKTDNKVDHMKLLRKNNLDRFNGKREQAKNSQQESQMYSQKWYALTEQYERAIKNSILPEKGINLYLLSQKVLQIYSTYAPQCIKLFQLVKNQPSKSKQYEAKKKMALRQIEKTRTADLLKINKLSIIEQCLKYQFYDCLIQKYTLLQNTYQLDKQSIIFIHIFISMLTEPNKLKLTTQIIRYIIFKLVIFVRHLQSHESSQFEGYFCVLLECLFNFKVKLGDDYCEIVRELCQIIRMEVDEFDEYIDDYEQESILPYYLEKVDDLLYHILSNIKMLKEQDSIQIAYKCRPYMTLNDNKNLPQSNNLNLSPPQINQFYNLFKDTLTKYIINSYRMKQPNNSTNHNNPFISSRKHEDDDSKHLQIALELLEDNVRQEDNMLSMFLMRYGELSDLVRQNRKEQLKKNLKKYEFVRFNCFGFMGYLQELSQRYHQNYLQMLVYYYQQLRAMYYLIYLSNGNLTKLQQIQKALALQLQDLLSEYPQINSIRFGQLLKQLSL